MSTRSNNQGRAYEYAWMQTFYHALKEYRAVHIVNNSSLEANLRAWNLVPDVQELLKVSATATMKTILELEPQLTESSSEELLLEFQQDQAGISGDVRDIVLKCNATPWEIGFSIKHNHDAVKHSRLGHSLDFGQEWFHIPCDSSYWKTVTPIFNRLNEAKNKKLKWSQIPDKKESVYIPLLNAFMAEIKRVCSSKQNIPQKLVEYLLGTKDYYKVISIDSKRLTLIRTFNLHGSLNKPSRVKISAITVPLVKLPTQLIAIQLKPQSATTIEMYFNNGWQFNFRLHSASSKVEPSLKFDIQCIGMPVSILNIECKWNS